jgi:flagellar biosynthesis protein FliP
MRRWELIDKKELFDWIVFKRIVLVWDFSLYILVFGLLIPAIGQLFYPYWHILMGLLFSFAFWMKLTIGYKFPPYAYRRCSEEEMKANKILEVV